MPSKSPINPSSSTPLVSLQDSQFHPPKALSSRLSDSFANLIGTLIDRILDAPQSFIKALKNTSKTTFIRIALISLLALIIVAIVGIFRKELIVGGWGCQDASIFSIGLRNGSFVIHENLNDQTQRNPQVEPHPINAPTVSQVRLTDTLIFYDVWYKYNVTETYNRTDLRPVPGGFDSRILESPPTQYQVILEPEHYSKYLIADSDTPRGYTYFAWIEANVTASLLLLDRDCKQSLLFWTLETLRSIPIYFSAPIFIILYAIACVLFVPGLILTLAAGFLFKWWGLPIVSCASVLGATLAFLMGRTLARKLVASAIRKYPRFRAIDRAIEKEGWKIILLLRLIPLIPFNLLNYALGLTSARLFDYVWASFVGMMPGTALFVYFGISAGSIASIIAGRVSTGGIYTQLISLAVSGVFIVAVFVVILFIAKRAMKKYMVEEGEEGDENGCETDSYLAGLESSEAIESDPEEAL